MASGRGAIISNKAVETMAEENKRGMSVFSSVSFCSIGASKLGNCGGRGREKPFLISKSQCTDE
jgi:hypothetical protein